VLRAIRPYATRVREFETAVVDGLRQAEEADDTVRREAHLLDDRVSALDERVNRRLAELDAKVARLSPPRPAAAPSGGGDAPEDEVPLLASDPPFRPGDPPIPPLEMRQLIGREDPAAFDNPSGALVFPDLAAEQYSAVFDFGCGCGRLARMLVQQRPRPSRYVGVDLHRGMVAWCTRNLTPYAPGFEFVHHDVYTAGFNPGGAREPVPFPVEDGAFSLVTALSVFTHLVEEHARFYLHECSRILRDDGLIRSTWFLFDKRYYPMMQDFQNALYINLVDPTNAVVFDRDWLIRQLEEAGLALVAAAPPAIRGFQWTLDLRRAGRGATPVGLPDDLAPFGSKPPPVPTFDPSRVA
jgi:SAM-dependent methyltransferase